jgi:anti-anti-sigma factor
MSESQRIKTEVVRNGVVAYLLTEKVTDYEASVLTPELMHIAENSRWRIVLDMTKVALLASAGIRVLISLEQRCKKEKGKFIITGLSGELLDLIKITRLDKLFTISKDPKAAAESLA